MNEEQFLVFAPTGRDAALTCQLLERAGMAGRVCRDLAELCDVFVREGAAAAFVAQEALTRSGMECLATLLEAQEPWSDLPILLFMTVTALAGDRWPTLARLAPLGNVTLLERPVRALTMQSAARAALRARRRQYLARAEVEAQRDAVRQRDEFLAMLGHELRNPLAAISLATDLLEQAPENVARYREILRRQSGHLAHLVDDLLDVARVTTGKISLAHGPVDLGALVAHSLELREPVAAAQGLRLAYQPPEGVVVVAGDAVRLEQIVTNLVENSIKYTPAGGAIEVVVERGDHGAVLRITDTGVGLEPQMLDRIFDLFMQADGTLDRARGGMGIGLTLVRRLVELHGGAIEAASEGPGRGTCFTIRLPLAPDDAVAAPSLEAAATVETIPQDVLVVEDNPESRELLVELLAASGHHVDAASDGPAGVALAIAHPPGVALIDIGLPGFDGYMVAREVRAALGDRVRLVAITGYGQPDDRERAMEAGFDSHLTKPVDLRELHRVLSRTA